MSSSSDSKEAPVAMATSQRTTRIRLISEADRKLTHEAEAEGIYRVDEPCMSTNSYARAPAATSRRQLNREPAEFNEAPNHEDVMDYTLQNPSRIETNLAQTVRSCIRALGTITRPEMTPNFQQLCGDLSSAPHALRISSPVRNAAVEIDRLTLDNKRLREENARLRRDSRVLLSCPDSREGAYQRSDRTQGRSRGFEQTLSEADDMIGNLKRENQRLVVEADKVDEACRSTIGRLDRDLVERNKEIKELRAIIQENTDKGELLDSDYKNAFDDMCADIRKLVRKFCRNASKPSINTDTDDRTRRVYGNLAKRGSKPKYGIMGAIFTIFEETHFYRPLFGLDAEGNGTPRGFEDKMRQSEKNMPEDIADWRRRTVSCLCVLDGSPVFHPGCQRQILNLITPVVCQLPEEREQIEEAVRDLCEKMYALTIMLRRSRSEFKLIWLDPIKEPRVLIAEDQPDVFVEDVIGESGQVIGAEVHQVIMGGLEKIHHKRQDRVVLTKAHVVALSKDAQNEKES